MAVHKNTYACGFADGYKKGFDKAELQNSIMVPSIYASLAIALRRKFNFSYDKINRVFTESQNIWNDFDGDLRAMIIKCYEETGIELMTQEEFDALPEDALYE